MLVDSEVAAVYLPSGLTPMPSGSTPTGTSPITSPLLMSMMVTRLSSSLAMEMILPVGSMAISSGSGPDSSSRLFSNVLVSITSMISPSPAATNSSLKSGLSIMPRGRRDTLIVLFTCSVSASTTVMVLSFSLHTKIVVAKAGAAKRRTASAPAAAVTMRVMGVTGGSLKLALGLRLIEAKSVGDVIGVQEAFLRGDRDGHTRAAAKNDRLAQLVVPGPETHGLSLETLEPELVGEKIGLHFRRRELPRNHHAIGQRPAAEPRGVVALGRRALGNFRYGILQMHGAIFRIGGVPGDRLKPLGPHDWPRKVGSVREVVAEAVIAVHDPNHVMVGSLLRYHRNLALHLLVA